MRQTEACRRLVAARQQARLQLRQLATALGVHPRTVKRWEIGETRPSKAEWERLVAVLHAFVPNEALELASAAEVGAPVRAQADVDAHAIEAAISRAADELDVAPRRVRAALREITRSVTAARGSLDDLARAAEEPVVTEPSA